MPPLDTVRRGHHHEGANLPEERIALMQDRQLVLVVQGDDITTSYHMWLSTPCDEHGFHVIANGLDDVEGIDAESPHTWLATALQRASQELCLCGGRQVSGDIIQAVKEATRG